MEKNHAYRTVTVVFSGLLALGCGTESTSNGTSVGTTGGGTTSGGTTAGGTTTGGGEGLTDPQTARFKDVCSEADLTALAAAHTDESCDDLGDGAAYADCLKLTDNCKPCVAQVVACLTAAIDYEGPDTCADECQDWEPGDEQDGVPAAEQDSYDCTLACDYKEIQEALAACDLPACTN